jgi:hypothetical protein
MATIYLTLSEKSDTLDLKEIRVTKSIFALAYTNVYINEDDFFNNISVDFTFLF